MNCNELMLSATQGGITCSPTLIEYTKALVKAQKCFTSADKSKTGQVGAGRFQYSSPKDLADASLEHLHANGFAIKQSVFSANGTYYVSTWLLHESGEWTFEKIHFTPKDPNNEKDIGKAISYFKRYMYKSSLGLVDEEDGEDASPVQKYENKYEPKKAPSDTPFEIRKIWAIYNNELAKDRQDMFLELMEKNCGTRKINDLKPEHYNDMIKAIQRFAE